MSTRGQSNRRGRGPKRGRGSPAGRGGGGRSGQSGRGGNARGGAGGGNRRGRGHQRSDVPQKRQRSDLGGVQVEGRHAVRELLLAGTRKVQEVMVLDDPERSGSGADEIVELCHELHVQVRAVSRRVFEDARTSESPQGVIARARPIESTPLHELVEADTGEPPFLMALDGVTDPGNLGALIRSAECAGVSGVVLSKHRSAHITPTVAKAAAGAVEYVPMSLVGGLPAALKELSEAGVWIVGLDEGGERSLHDLELGAEPICLVMGAEGSGLSRLVRERCDVVASIPLRGRLSSLNVSVAGALACFEVVRRRGEGPGQ